MKTYRSKYGKLPGSDLKEVIKLARHEYHLIQKRTPRRKPYAKSKYFTKDKIFINNFWNHLNQKSSKDRVRRLKYYSCAIDLLRNTTYSPDTIYTSVDMNIGFHIGIPNKAKINEKGLPQCSSETTAEGLT